MKALYVDSDKKFVFIRLQDFCKKRGIIIKYITPYVYEENRLAKRKWRTIMMKDAILIDSSLPNNF